MIEMWATRVNLISAYSPSECSKIPVSDTCRIVEPNNISTHLPLDAQGELLVEGPIVGFRYATILGAQEIHFQYHCLAGSASYAEFWSTRVSTAQETSYDIISTNLCITWSVSFHGSCYKGSGSSTPRWNITFGYDLQAPSR
ncbi:uncharacterized protein BO87DRAFT_125974 [Aspergillus neoniger CBS 115656]|uniref:Uncharacterized protein n=1 Tax=Aspergillus neoniger (strain CBS 115656) TaxID=1448310 RepID=A0A318YAR7_ASPNB|nr:hypothetical protein BO87DRAFT_125974 [Aspergillus neoniger CBS 115656]PYH31455.1 hypothetical protein BO87DRAFT_125974 [Aspergillus neoniger CBS 115656]